jgi:hypothetical protein
VIQEHIAIRWRVFNFVEKSRRQSLGSLVSVLAAVLQLESSRKK